MSYYQVPYMAALIRYYELGLEDTGSISEELLNADQETIRAKLNDFWLDGSILDATGRDDYILIENVVERLGNEAVRDDYLNKRTLEKVLQNMKKLYADIRGE